MSAAGCFLGKPHPEPETEPDSVEDARTLFKEKAMKCKLISLDEMGYNPLIDPVTFSKREQKKLLEKMHIWFAKPDEEMQEEFNEIVRDKLFDEKGGMDYTKFPIQDNAVTYEPHPEWKPAVDMSHQTEEAIESED